MHRDGVNGLLRPRRGASLAALTSGGAIPETGDYRVVLDPDGVTVGSVHEDFAVEATIGDIFLLGTHSSVSYTHLDVYKRQALGSDVEGSDVPIISLMQPSD